MKKRISIYILIGLCTLVSCQKLRDKISPQGILMAGTAVEDRVKMSNQFYRSSLDNRVWLVAYDKYSFLVGADSHLTTDPGRMDEMLAIGLRDDDLFYAHLGDLADTKAEYYYTLDSLVKKAKERYVEKYYTQVTSTSGNPIPSGTLWKTEAKLPTISLTTKSPTPSSRW